MMEGGADATLEKEMKRNLIAASLHQPKFRKQVVESKLKNKRLNKKQILKDDQLIY
jgi:hypothetical protein